MLSLCKDRTSVGSAVGGVLLSAFNGTAICRICIEEPERLLESIDGDGPEAESASSTTSAGPEDKARCLGSRTFDFAGLRSLLSCCCCSIRADKLERGLSGCGCCDTLLPDEREGFCSKESRVPVSLYEPAFPMTARAMLLDGGISGPYATP